MALDFHEFHATVSTRPGVYQMYNASGNIIYVGKAKNLKKRLASYFRKNLQDQKTRQLMSKVVEIKTTVTSNENEALILEANLIKAHKPRYNVLLRDDKSYPYLYLSTQHAFPRLDFYRGSRNKAGKFFGPYPSAASVRQNIALIQKLFLIRNCKDTFFKNRTRPCLQYQIKRCTAPCVKKASQESYAKQIQHAVLFLEGKNEAIIKELQEKMEKASQEKQYEQAATYRDQIIQLRTLQNKNEWGGKQTNVDIFGIDKQFDAVAVSVVFVRAGRVLGQRTFHPNTPAGFTKAEVLAQFIPQYYLNPLHQDERLHRVILSEALPDKLWLQSALQEQFGQGFVLTDRRLQKYRQWQAMAILNAKQALQQKLSHQLDAEKKLKSLQEVLKLKQPIRRVECFDISHTFGDSTVASCVVYGSEGALNKDYRRFNIKKAAKGDDYAAMREALLRRYTRLCDEGASLPDVIVIDGGKGQLTQAIEVMQDLQLPDIMLMSIAKGVSRKPGLEKMWLWQGRFISLHIDVHSLAFHLLQFVRDESHRFAITAHRKQRAKKLQQSTLEGISGVGPKRRKAILQHFGGMQELNRASVAQIAKVPGVSEPMAKMIYEFLHA